MFTGEKTIKELEIQIESLNQQEDELLKELNVTPEQLSKFVSQKDNFTEKNWEQLQKEREALEARIDRELSNIRNPRRASKSFADRQINQNWLFVK